ncbi:hypothetical protein NHG22_10775 [Streptomyces sp. ATE26]|uniref:hypothetical protein n=1 Tax=unclassified Streptomyces TaxID=2593676 RepID=UPI0011722ECA|nr:MULTISPECIES: hypothetical protein [unclassified Streptomyces]MDI1454295.1 hypothetical protein [Streptomyces sp. ATE26]GEJ99371.1 hypothetical protein TNCT1_16480 [Streptomyces sp. 1-11]
MTAHIAHTAHDMLGEDVARVVAGVPGVAFLKPGLAARLRSAWSGPGTGRRPAAGVRLTPGPGGWHVDVQLVASRRDRTVDVARAVRTAVQTHLAALSPGRPADRVTVTVTVTGLI